MSDSFFFYDLETSGISAKSARIMQFAGQRTDMDLNPIGEPYNILIKLDEDVVPEPDAILITGITPQKTWQDGITDAEFFKLFCNEIVQPDTIFTGFNTIRFDDEFMRYGLYRNFFDPYEWQWKDGNSRWDILDVVRMTRALRPDGIAWPFASDGKPSNRLELLTSLNNLEHNAAHDALCDVNATIAVAKMIRQKQPKLFDYLLSMRQKKQIEPFILDSKMFVYVSGRYSAEYEKLTIATAVGPHPKKGGTFVYDLRYDPSQYISLSAEKLADLWRWSDDKAIERLPVKTLQYNRCPAVAPLNVLRREDKERLSIDMEIIEKHHKTLIESNGFYDNLKKAAAIVDNEYTQTSLITNEADVDSKLYDGFLPDADKKQFSRFLNEDPALISSYTTVFSDPRLKALIPLFKARNFPSNLTDEERALWEKYKTTKLQARLPKFLERLHSLSIKSGLTTNQMYLIEELKLYAESIVPSDI